MGVRSKRVKAEFQDIWGTKYEIEFHTKRARKSKVFKEFLKHLPWGVTYGNINQKTLSINIY